MQFLPADAYQYLHMMSGMGIPMPSGTQDMAEYEEWVQDHSKRQNEMSAVPAGTQTSFYLILAFPQGDFADKLDIHEKYPMYIPATGTSPPILGVFADEKQAKIKMEADDENVHVMYKFKVPGVSGIQWFLETMAEHGLLEPVTGN